MTAQEADVTGLVPPARALYFASRSTRDRTLVVLVPRDADIDPLTGDIRFFLAALEGMSDRAVDQAVLPFPSLEVDPYRQIAPHLGVSSRRARALHAAATGTARVIVASADAVLPRLPPPERLLKAAVEIRRGTTIDPTDLASLLVDAGFTREDPVDQHGEFCLRGGVVDFFPAFESHPVRLDFIGDTVESIRRYDPASQRSIAEIDQVAVVPLRETFDGVPAGGPSSLFDYAAETLQPSFYVCEHDEFRARAEEFLERMERSYEVRVRSSGVAPTDEQREDDPFAGPGLGEDEENLDEGDAWPENNASPQSSVLCPDRLFLSLSDLDAMLSMAARVDELGIGTEGVAPPASLDLGSGHPSMGANEGPPPRAASTGGKARVPAVHISCQPSVGFHGRVPDWVADIRRARERGDSVFFVASSSGRAERTIEVLEEYEILAVPVEIADEGHQASVLVGVGRLTRGFRLPSASLQIYAEADVFEEEARVERRPSAARVFLSDFRDLKVGDLVVHVDHGIGVFVGLQRIRVSPADETEQEFMELRYAGDDKLFVPVERLDLVQKYSGAARPPLDRLGGTSWERAKTRVRKAMRDMAEELLKLYAARKAIAGHAFPPDTHWQEEFESAFEYELTPDQQAAVADIKRDLESPIPMDRLLCGDVGYGKTEVAMRAAFKVVMDGKQVAFLAPTTVLALQHLQTLTARFAAFPVRIDMVSRFRSRAEQKKTLADLAAGRVDIIVGTHRLLSKDVRFHDLGLLVVDEEQRFGVAHKERIKQMRRRVDVLTMTATPIPRTLNMSLVGIRDMSVIETPPKDRLSIQTQVVRFDQQVIARAVRSELARNGQVFFVHNRVESIFSIGHLLARLVPEARIVVAHGQMGEDELERAMVDFVAHKYDVLLATTIIENGLDIPNVNTIVINRADRYGLAQLYQLRGRVGRSDRPAYAYLLVPPEDSLTPVARKRLAAIREFSDLGSGFRVAALDLEIRGAGNLLGGEQSGHIEAVGFEMYTKLLEQTVRELKGEEIEDESRAAINLGVDLRIDEDYVPDMSQRLMLYRRVAAARSEREIEQILEEVRDRYGPHPPSVMNLADYGRIRVLADRLGVESIDRQGPLVVLTFRQAAGRHQAAGEGQPAANGPRAAGDGRPGSRMPGGPPGDGPPGSDGSPKDGRRGPDVKRLMQVIASRPGLTLVPPGILKLDLKAAAANAARGQVSRQHSGTEPASRAAPGSRAGGLAGGASRGRRGSRLPANDKLSWWTARATESEVKPGFTRDEILKPVREDPRGPEGVFTVVLDVLCEIAGAN